LDMIDPKILIVTSRVSTSVSKSSWTNRASGTMSAAAEIY
jgi:hypothetical protein